MRAELAVSDGMRPPDDLPQGECILTTIYDEAGQPADIRIDRADPRILISGELLETYIAGGVWPHTSLSMAPAVAGRLVVQGASHEPFARLDAADCKPRHGLIGATVKICGVNRTVVYRITGYIPRVHGYIGERPD